MASQVTQEHIEELLAKSLEKVQRLPYIDYLPESRVTDYFRNIIESGENPVWHVERLYGFGSSETGSLVADLRNRNRQPGDEYQASFKSARQVVAEKLMYKISESNEVMFRGKRMEPFIAELFITQLREAGHKVERAHDVLEKLKQSDGNHSEYSWLKGKNVDDILRVDGKLILIDYKAPSTDAFASVVNEQGGLGYQCQLNQYDLYAQDKGIQFDGFCLVPFDYYTATAQPIFLDRDEDLQQEIIEAGNHFWNEYVLQGRLPNIPTMYDHIYDPEKIPDDVYQKGAQYAALKAYEQNVAQLVSEAKSELDAMFARNGISGTVAYELGAITASSKKKLVLNDDAIVEEANRLGLDLAKYTTKGKLSIKRLYTAIEKLAKEDETIIMDNLAHIEQTGSVRRVSDSKPGYGLWEAVVSESEELLKSAVSQLTERQMSVLEHIKDIAKDQQDKIEVFRTLNTMVEKTGPLTLTVQDILSDVTVNEVSGNPAGKANPEQESIRDEQGNENSDTTASETESAAAIDPDEDFVVDFDDEYDEPAPIAGMSL